MRLTLTLSILIFQCCSFLSAQSFSWAWHVFEVGSSSVESMVTDAQGNIYSTGIFQHTVDFDPGPGTYTLTAAGGNDVFVSKLDSMGNLIWAISMGGTDNDAGDAITIDASGNVYVTGSFRGTADFDPGAGVSNLFSNGSFDIFVVRLTSTGGLTWAKSMGSTGVDGSNAIQVDGNGFVYTTGTFSGTMDVDPNPGITSLTALGPKDVFVWALNSAGQLFWCKNFGGPSVFAEGKDLALDPAGVLMVIGYFTNTCDFDPNAGVANRTSAGGYEGFLCALNVGGGYLNALTFGGIGNDYFEKIEFNPTTGNMYIAGYFENTADFDPGPGVYNLTSDGWQDAVVIKLNPFGSLAWARKFGSTWVDYGLSVDIDSEGNVYTGGVFNNTVDFNPGAGIDTLTSLGLGDGFVVKLDSAGNYLDVLRVGGSAGDDRVLAVNVGPGDVLHHAGFLYGSADLNPYSGNYVVGGYYQDGFLVRLGACISNSSTVNVYACNSYIAPDSNVYTTSGVYYATIANAAGCDSAITINLTIDTVIAYEINNAPLLTVIGVVQGSTYQWVDCNNNYAAIPGATYQQFIPAVNGSYAAIVTNSNCRDTSSCMTVLNTGITLYAPDSEFSIHPNPAQDFIKVSLPAQSIVRITDVTGRVLSTETIPQDGMLSVQHLAIGTYFVTEVKTGRTLKLMKQ